MAPKTSTFFDLKTCLGKSYRHSSSLPESAGAGGCGLFLGRLDQELVGNAESTHVHGPKGKATFVPEGGRCCNG